ncbi:PaaI family thioesterase [Pseudonocardia sp. WMMC193]|uniref:PaaI family thioesterase n=1 Tax=Pseudonocardia sp. WMMC193 TaxID=2911965 RepID=UPI001F3732E0|nr:PaaI family thioesterase [Pseudonocardia sp. WMMC193]MCF7550764.1 PaaI family thioesterase [Pseudonocardia sp. WMMC193]
MTTAPTPLPAEAVRLDPHGPACFGCGPANPGGIGLEVFRVGDEVVADVVFPERLAGAHGVVHGGVVASACDDLMAFLLYVLGKPAVTRSLTVDYLAPVPVGEPHRLRGRIVERAGRRVVMSAVGEAADGTARFTADAVFVEVDLAHFARFRPDAAEDPFSRFDARRADPLDPVAEVAEVAAVAEAQR